MFRIGNMEINTDINTDINNNIPYDMQQKVAGAYFKYQRQKKEISLNVAAKGLNVNKGFLSELENGKRHFPEGMIDQMNAFYSANFDQSYVNSSNDFIDIIKAYNASYRGQEKKEKEILRKIYENSKLENSYYFLAFQLIKMVFYLKVDENDHRFFEAKKIMEECFSVITDSGKSLFYNILGLYYFKHRNMKEAKSCFEISDTYPINIVPVYTINKIYLSAVYMHLGELVRSLQYCTQAKNRLLTENNAFQMQKVLLIENICLSFFGVNDVVNANLNKMLEELDEQCGFDEIYLVLSINNLLNGKYEQALYDLNQIKSKDLYLIEMLFSKISCLYRLSQFEECLQMMETLKKSKERDVMLYCKAIKAYISEDFNTYYKYLFNIYKYLLKKSQKIRALFILNEILTSSKKLGNNELELLTYRDIELLKKGELKLENCELLKVEREIECIN